MKPAIYSKEYERYEKEESFHKCEGGVHFYDFDSWYYQDEHEPTDYYSDFYDYLFDYDLDCCNDYQEQEVSDLYDEVYDYDD